MPDKQAASPLVEVGLGEREGLVYPNARAPQHNDQSPHPPAVTAISGLAHDRDDLVDLGRLGRVTATFVRWDPPGVVAEYWRRGPGAAGGVQQLMSRAGSLLWSVDTLLPALTEPARTRAWSSPGAGELGCCRLPGRLRKRRNQRSSSSL
jgi:hypothetical protein